MTTQFIVTVNHVRAQVAWAKALADFDAVLPALLEEARAHDARINAEADAFEEKSKEEWRQYEKDLRAWEALRTTWRPSWFGNPFPEMPRAPTTKGPKRSYRVAELENERHYLVSRKIVIDAAVAPFNLTEDEVRDMVRMENGEYVALVTRPNYRYMRGYRT